LTRVLHWDGCVNVRDLGGLPLRDGGETRFRVLVRADSLRTLTEEGRRALVAYGVTHAVDLRGDWELDEDAPSDLAVPVTRVPIDPRGNPVLWTWPSIREAYEELLNDFRPQFAAAVAALARAEPPVAVHCLGGRDRTGIVCGLVSWLAGVEPDAIAADHGLSDESWGPHNAAWFDGASDEAERQRRRRIAAPAGRTLADVLEALEEREGVRGYLRAGGVAERDLDTIVLRLRG
jgi:protein tyrosine/serine phosphatase